MTGTGHNFRRLHFVEKKNNLSVGKVTEALQRFRCNFRRESNACLLPTPKVVFRVRTNGFDKADSSHRFDHANPLMSK